MNRTKHESRTLPFACQLVGKTVDIHQDMTVRVGSSGEELTRFATASECSERDNCPIATHTAGGTTYDISRCEFVKRRP